MSPRFAQAVALSVALAMAMTARAEPQPSVEELLARVGQRVAEFYYRVQNLVCIETSQVQPIGLNFSPEGFSRSVESELRLEADGGDAPGEPVLVRQVRKVNGRAPRQQDQTDRAGCTDPNPLSNEPLTFLLPGHHSEYIFKAAGAAKDRNRDAWLIDFESVNRRSDPELVEDKTGHEDCFDWNGHIASRGRIWVDAATYDVVRLERSNRGPVDVNVPARIQQRHHLGSYVTIDRDDTTIRYKMVAFSDPDETLLVPESIQTLLMVRGGLQSTRRSQMFSDYRRFVTAGRVVQ
jgi:hypothetical protein